MNKLNVLKAVKSIAGVAAVTSAVVGTAMVVKAVRQYQEDSIKAINKAETEGYDTDEEAKEATEKLQNDAVKVIVSSAGTIAVSSVFALIALKASNAADDIIKNNIALHDSFSGITNSCLLDKIGSSANNIGDAKAFCIEAVTNDARVNSSRDLFVNAIKNAQSLYDESKVYIIDNVDDAVKVIISAKKN